MQNLAIGLAILGVLGSMISFIILIIQAVRRKRKKPWVLSIVGFIFLLFIAAGLEIISEEPIKKAEKPVGKIKVEKETKPPLPESKHSIKEQKPKVIKEEKIIIPKYKILDEEIYDAPVKTQVALKILVSGELSKSSLRALLNKLYSSTQMRKGFKYHKSPTNIYIWVFTSKERAESGMGQWIAMLAKSYDDTKPKVDFNERQIAQLGAKPEERFGLSEKKRKEIWKELVLVEDRAWEEAKRQFPSDPTQVLHEGQIFQLIKETPLMPELEPADPLAALKRMRQLPPETRIKILKVAKKREIPWYFVEARSPTKLSLGSGWINSIALTGQVDLEEQLRKQANLENRLIDKYKDELREEYGLTREQLKKISIEGIEKNWPLP